MQEKEPESWLARDGDGRVLEVEAAGYPGGEASPDDGRPVAEAEEATREDLTVRPVPWVAEPDTWESMTSHERAQAMAREHGIEQELEAG